MTTAALAAGPGTPAAVPVSLYGLLRGVFDAGQTADQAAARAYRARRREDRALVDGGGSS